eukprot:CAMPEP_0168521958 /NCGR_PEP_ID=MMETSP0405-20121227/8991_1 /TAXON_ID=498012 /ORGANISM="Trichosphaerium sp, Strain Am-I-7 wt" /LENGTH=208 /DNA_ID=CAMNT_0008543327 /DNA_START=372 /DNA_END=998 /DNA_ORIENTATION=-
MSYLTSKTLHNNRYQCFNQFKTLVVLSILMDKSLEEVSDDVMSIIQPDQPYKLPKLLGYLHDVFAVGKKPGHITVKNRIKVPGDVVSFHITPYQVSLNDADIIIEENTESMLKNGVIRPFELECATMVVLVPKSDGTLRFCVDYRAIASYAYPFCITHGPIFSKVDCSFGYWLIDIYGNGVDMSTCKTRLGQRNYVNCISTFRSLTDV